uniref:Uncharacterized protein n=1 Tax=Setaria italica TaxID=4555 RepID=K4AN29_SETIT
MTASPMYLVTDCSAAADRVVRGLVQRGGGGAEGGHGQGARARAVCRRRRVRLRGGVPRARERQSLPAQPAHAHILTPPSSLASSSS